MVKDQLISRKDVDKLNVLIKKILKSRKERKLTQFLVFLPSSRFDILSPFDIAPIDFAIKCFPLSNCFIDEKVIFEKNKSSF